MSAPELHLSTNSLCSKWGFGDLLRLYERGIYLESVSAQPGDPIPTNLYSAHDALLAAVRHLASVYAARPGCRQEWAP